MLLTLLAAPDLRDRAGPLTGASALTRSPPLRGRSLPRDRTTSCAAASADGTRRSLDARPVQLTTTAGERHGEDRSIVAPRHPAAAVPDACASRTGTRWLAIHHKSPA